MATVSVRSVGDRFETHITTGDHLIVADEPPPAAGVGV